MNQRIVLICVAIWAAIVGLNAQNNASTSLPVVEILGDNYYYYEVKKGDSLYGICKIFGWDEPTLRKLNPGAVGSLKKGMRIYYPTAGNRQPEQETAASVKVSKDPIVHEVKRGETVYSISKQYGVPIEIIYNAHPSAREGIKAGETIIIPQDDSASAKYYFYNIKHGDTLYRVAKSFNTTVADIMELNPGVSESNFQAGAMIKLQPGSDKELRHTEIVEEQQLEGFGNYKVKKGDTWSSIADKTGTKVDELISANNGKELKKNGTISLPTTKTVEVERVYIEEDPREKTPEGRMELYADINNVDPVFSAENRVNAAILMADPTSTRDLEFLRGMLLAVDGMKNTGIKIDLQTLTEIPDSAMENIDIVFNTGDDGISEELAERIKNSKVELVNVFDVKSTRYVDNPSIIQLLPPSAIFNASVANYLLERFGSYDMVFIGRQDGDDAMADDIKQAFKGKFGTVAFEDFKPVAGKRYLLYVSEQRKAEVEKALTAIATVAAENPEAEIVTIGRPSWVIFARELNEKLGDANTYIPSRVYFDENAQSAATFNADFERMFGHTPILSFPIYAAMGYDVANYFLPMMASNRGDMSNIISSRDGLQTTFELSRVSNWGGYINNTSVILHVTPGEISKIVIK